MRHRIILEQARLRSSHIGQRKSVHWAISGSSAKQTVYLLQCALSINFKTTAVILSNVPQLRPQQHVKTWRPLVCSCCSNSNMKPHSQ
jgi:hypothetical protein